MISFEELVKKLCIKIDILAGMFFFSVMALVVLNVFMRTVLNRPITGAYELVGLLTAMGVSLAVANCALSNGHIVVGYFVDRLSQRKQVLVDFLVNTISLIFWSLVSWQLIKYGGVMFYKGVVSSTALIPLYPFIYLLAFGMILLCLVLTVTSVICFKRALSGFSILKYSWTQNIEEIARKTS